MADYLKVLGAMTKQQLEIACIVNDVDFPPKCTKAELVKQLEPVLKDEKVLDRIYPYLSDEEIDVLHYYLAHEDFEGIWDRYKLKIFEQAGFACEKGGKILISDILCNYLQKPHHSLEQKRKQFGILINYFTACANLYGIFPNDLAFDLYCKYEHKRMNKTEMNRAIDMFYNKDLPFEPEDEFIVNAEVYNIDDDYPEQLFDEQAHKPYAILPKEELMCYLDPNYVERNKYYHKMVTMFVLLFGMSKEEANEITTEVSHMAKAQLPFDDIFEFLDHDFGVSFKDMDEYNQFLKVYTDLNNHTRLWENCGYSPEGLRKRLRQV